MAGGITDAEMDGLTLLERLLESLLAPGVPVDRIVRMLAQIRTGLGRQPVRVFRRTVRIQVSSVHAARKNTPFCVFTGAKSASCRFARLNRRERFWTARRAGPEGPRPRMGRATRPAALSTSAAQGAALGRSIDRFRAGEHVYTARRRSAHRVYVVLSPFHSQRR